jgi:hypothetical protein
MAAEVTPPCMTGHLLALLMTFLLNRSMTLGEQGQQFDKQFVVHDVLRVIPGFGNELTLGVKQQSIQLNDRIASMVILYRWKAVRKALASENDSHIY